MTETKNGRSRLRTQSENSKDDVSLEGLLRKMRFNIDAEMIGLMAMQRDVPHKHSKLRICPAPAASNTEKSSRKTCEDVPHRSQKKNKESTNISMSLLQVSKSCPYRSQRLIHRPPFDGFHVCYTFIHTRISENALTGLPRLLSRSIPMQALSQRFSS